MSTKKRATKGSVGIESFQGRLRLRLPRQLYGGKQKYLTLGLPNTPESRTFAQSKASQIELDIIAGYFDPSLEKYRGDNNPSRQTKETGSNQVSLDLLWDMYAEYKSKFLSVTTINKDFKRVRNHIASLPSHRLGDAVFIRNTLLTNLSPNAAKRVLTQLKACYDWAIDSKLVTENPYEGMPQKIKAVSQSEGDNIYPFSSAEQAAIIASFSSSRYYKHYTPYVSFLFLTGCRTSEAIGLTWQHIDAELTQITFCEAVVDGHRKETKTRKVRKFPINSSLRALLLSIRPEERGHSTPVFLSPKGNLIDAHNFLNRAWKRILATTDTPYRPQYNTRHTFITNCLEAGVSVVQVARWVGNSPEVIMKHYAGTIKKTEVPEF
jgi:integrase